MTRRNRVAIARMATVLIPVVVGSLLGLIVSLATSSYTFHRERTETLRKEHLAHRERAVMLTGKYSNDVSKLLGIGFLTNGNVDPKELALLTAPTETLLELNAVVVLYFPKLKGEVDQILTAHAAMIQRFDDITGTHNKRRGEDAAAFTQRIQKEIVPLMERVRNLMEKLSKQ